MTQDRPTRSRRGTTLKLLAAAVVVIALVVVLGTVDLPDPSFIRDRVASAGPWGIALFVVLYAVLSATPFPASTLTIASGLLFGLAVGATVVVFAATMGAYLGYWGARALGRGQVARTEWDRLRRLDAMLGRRGLLSVLLVRLVPLPFSLVNYAAGVSAVGQRDYVVGTMIGIVPATVAYTALGAYGTSPLSWPFAIALLAVLAIAAGSALLARRLGLTGAAE
ncbi:VTT domain-containing protein [Rhodococcus sp. ARC_M12]|uniref:TVP38/TMEM64 family protein n=1 Tax=unclassified Rhodococcus (in: high G+C Gram-positive bacteria) TaxID=192944 RepID=UPI001FB2FC40|nr:MULTISPECIES: VTT domain-containing protein [unclassified Rhodococcus (in: high G+C Gram-positive bacteria)]MCJ0894095.1 VTT domain-containing protein [Rhodococcus sp. ARC_M5]MCJ0977433.1 VTT domain-containing protein [Rhodococcus sp. ARC_M12]